MREVEVVLAVDAGDDVSDDNLEVALREALPGTTVVQAPSYAHEEGAVIDDVVTVWVKGEGLPRA